MGAWRAIAVRAPEFEAVTPCPVRPGAVYRPISRAVQSNRPPVFNLGRQLSRGTSQGSPVELHEPRVDEPYTFEVGITPPLGHATVTDAAGDQLSKRLDRRISEAPTLPSTRVAVLRLPLGPHRGHTGTIASQCTLRSGGPRVLEK